MPGIDEFLPQPSGGIDQFTPGPTGKGIDQFLPGQQQPSQDYSSMIRSQAQQMGLDPEQVLTLARFESGLNPTATSKAGAYGLMQVMPSSAGGMNIKEPSQNIARGLQLWKEALNKYKDPRLAYAKGYNPGYVGTGPFGVVRTPAPTAIPKPSLAPSPKPTPQGPQIVDHPSGNGLGGLLGKAGIWAANLPGIRDIGDIYRSTWGRPVPVIARSLEERDLYTRHGLLVDEAGNVYDPNGHPVMGTNLQYWLTATIPAGPAPFAKGAQQTLQRVGIVPREGGLIREATPVRPVVEKGISQLTGVPVQPAIPVEQAIRSAEQLPLGLMSQGDTHTLPSSPGGTVRPILQSRRADETVRAINAEQASRQAGHMSFLRGAEYQALTTEQKSELFHLLHTPQSPLLTGQWPSYVTPKMQQVLTEGMRELRSDYLTIKGLSPEAQELLLGKQVEDPTTVYFPRRSLTHAIEEKKLGGLGARRIRKSAGSLKRRKLPQDLTEAEKQHQYIQDPFLTLFDAQNEMRVARQTREMMERWKTDPEFKNIVSAPGEPHPDTWVRAPWLGKDFYVEPHLAKVADRIRGMRFSDPGRYRVLNNWSLNISFGLWPFAHHRNLIYNYLAATRAITRPDLFADATREVNGFGDKYIRFLELGGGTQFLDVRRQQMLAKVIQQTAQDPEFKNIGTGALARYMDWQHTVTWKFDAVLNMQSVLYLTKRGIPFDDAVNIVTKRIPNYYLPSFFTGPKALQGVADLTHEAVTRSGMFIFAPYHYGLAKGLQHALGPKNWDMLASILVADQVVWPHVLEPMLQKAGAEYYRLKGDKYNERRWSRVHVTEPGYGRVSEGLKAGMGQELGVLRAAPKGHKISEGLREAGPALGTMGRTLLTVSPFGRAAADVMSWLSGGGAPDLSQLVPFGTPQEAYKVLTGKTPPVEAAGSFGGVYPRYYLPLEYQAAQAKQNLPKISSQVYALRRSGQIQQANTLVENTRVHLYTLYLAAARDLQKQGFKLPSTPEAFAQSETEADMMRRGLGLIKSPSIRPARPTPKRIMLPKPGQPTLPP